MKNIEYFIGQKLYLEVNMIGYKTMGESIILSLKSSDSTVLWTAVIDCYKYDNLNITYDALKEMGYGNDKKIDLLCITHPDEDHTKDIKTIMNDFTNNNTIYLMPDFLVSNITETNDIKEIRKIINCRFSRHSDGRLNNIFYNRNINEPNLNWKFIGSDNKKHILRIETYLPTDSIMTMSRNENSQYKNDYSLFINLIIDDKNNYVFTGDCMDYSIVCLEEEDIQKMNSISYFKIPHHGSDIKSMQELITNNKLILNNVSTCSFRKGTTRKEILDFYYIILLEFRTIIIYGGIMASTTKEKKNSRKYYKTHKKYREEKIEDSVKKQKSNPKKHAEYQKEYYHENQDYRAYKIKYARDYRKREPQKSRARKDRKPR